MGALSIVDFPAGAAAVVSGWAVTAGDVAAWCSRTDVPVPPEVVAAWGEAEDVRAFLLLDGDDPVGYGELWLDDDEHEVEIAHVLVRPDRRGRGLGRALARGLAARARQVYPSVFLRLVPGNEAAAASYRAAGFVRMTPAQEREWNEGQPRTYQWMAFPEDSPAG